MSMSGPPTSLQSRLKCFCRCLPGNITGLECVSHISEPAGEPWQRAILQSALSLIALETLVGH